MAFREYIIVNSYVNNALLQCYILETIRFVKIKSQNCHSHEKMPLGYYAWNIMC